MLKLNLDCAGLDKLANFCGHGLQIRAIGTFAQQPAVFKYVFLRTLRAAGDYCFISGNLSSVL